MEHHVVVWDPSGEYWEGALVDAGPAQLINTRGGITVPADPALFAVAGVGAYHRRAWGSGWPADHTVPRLYAPLTLFLMREHRVIHWAARLVPDLRFGGPEALADTTATLTLAHAPPRGNLLTAPLTPRTQPARLRDLGAPDANGGWTVRGHAFLNVAAEGSHGFSLYGSGGPFRVAFAAAGAVRV